MGTSSSLFSMSKSVTLTWNNDTATVPHKQLALLGQDGFLKNIIDEFDDGHNTPINLSNQKINLAGITPHDVASALSLLHKITEEIQQKNTKDNVRISKKKLKKRVCKNSELIEEISSLTDDQLITWAQAANFLDIHYLPRVLCTELASRIPAENSCTSKLFTTIKEQLPDDLQGRSMASLITKVPGMQPLVSEAVKINAIKTFKGHEGGVYSLINVTDTQIASGSCDNTIKLWDVTTGKCIKTFNGHKAFVYSLILVTDNQIASGSGNNTIKLWDVSTGKCIKTLTGHRKGVLSLLKVTDKQIASGSSDKTIKLWNISTGKCIKTLTGHDGNVWSLIKITEHQIASGSSDNTIKLWNMTTGECTETLTGHNGSVWSLLKVTDHQLASGSGDGTIKLWDLRELNDVNKKLNTVTCAQFELLQQLANNTNLELSQEQKEVRNSLPLELQKAFTFKDMLNDLDK